MPTVSVIIPVYKVEKYLRRCVDSVLKQTFIDFELILVDDGSPDGCPSICDEYAEQDARVRVIHQKNAGVSAARNAGLDAAIGHYVTFADSDDYLAPTMLQTMSDVLKSTDSEIVQCDFQTNNQKMSESKTDVEVLKQEEAVEELLRSKKVSYGVWDKMFSRSVWNGFRFDTSVSHNEDFLFDYFAFTRAKQVALVHQPLYHYCVNGDSATHVTFSQKRMTAIDAQDTVLADVLVRFPNLRSTAVREYLKVNIFNARQMLEAGYDHPEDFRRIQKNLLSRFGSLLFSDLAFGYKLQGVAILCGKPFLRLLQRIKK